MLKSAGAALLGLSFFSLLALMLIFLLPGAENSLIRKANDEYAPRMVPVLISHEPQLSTLTYENTRAYCRSNAPGADMEFGGISDDYVCSLIENNYVSNTDELRLRLARELVSNKIGEVMAAYGPELAAIHSKLPLAFAVFAASLLLSFPFLYFGSRNLVELAFNLSTLAAAFSFLILALSALAFLLVPGQIAAYAKATAPEPLYADLITAGQDLIAEAVAELLLPPIIFFGLVSLASGLSAAAFFYYLSKLRPR